MNILDRRINVAPMMDWTDRHCRYLHRLFAPHALLYTEMIVAAAIVRGDAASARASIRPSIRWRCSSGAATPASSRRRRASAAAAGFAEINLNVGCPSDGCKSGAFGACLMLRPALVAECVRRMREATASAGQVKCRIGIDARDDYEFFAEFVAAVAAPGRARSSCTRARRSSAG